jgi:hypothetical protein
MAVQSIDEAMTTPQATGVAALTPMSMEVLDTQRHAVLAARRFRDSLASHIRELHQNWTMQHADVLEALEDAKADLQVKEQILKDMSLAIYRETGARDLGPGLRIRTKTRVRFSEEEALAMARERGIFLKLDKKPFETYARDFPSEVPFAQSETKAEVQIAADLARALQGA